LKAEIEERKKAEALLVALSQSVQEQARVLDQILSASPQHFYLFDNKGKFIYASKPAADLLGLAQPEFAGKYWWDLGFPESVMRVLDIERDNVLRTGTPWKGRLQFPTTMGMRDFEYILSPIVRPEGKVDTVVAAARDVTEEKQAQEELAVRTARLQEQAQLIDLTHETIIVRDMTGKILFWNAGAEEMLGWKREEAIGKEQSSLLETEFPLPLDEVEEILLQDGRWEGELVQTARDGSRLDVASRQVVRWSEGHQPEAILEIDSDISDRRALQDELEARVASLEHQAHLLGLIPRPVFVTDMNSTITFWNAAAEQVFGWTSDEAIGKVSHELLRIEFERPLADVEFDLLNNGSWQGELVYIAKDMSRVTANSHWTLEWDEGGEPASIIEVVC
ncbi:MAG: PAS domain-containing protein, partial [Candidatus Geothermincolia bacterium]